MNSSHSMLLPPVEITFEHRLTRVKIDIDESGACSAAVTFQVVNHATGEVVKLITDTYTGEEFNGWYASFNSTTALFVAHAVRNGLSLPAREAFDRALFNAAPEQPA